MTAVREAGPTIAAGEWSVAGFDPRLPVKNDTDFFYRLLSAGFRYGVVGEYLVFQRKHSSGQLTGSSPRRAAGTLAYLDKHRASLTLRDRRFLRNQGAEKQAMWQGMTGSKHIS